MMNKNFIGIDVSTHNGEIEWDKVSSEVNFAMIRCGYGKTGDDKRFIENAEGCKKFGIPFGVYYFSYAGNNVEAEHEALRAIQLADRFKPQIGIAFDFEDDSLRYIRDKGYSTSTENIEYIAKSFLDVIEKNSNYTPILYTNVSYYKKYYYNLTCSKWLAQWGVNEPSVDCDIWQYSSKGKVSGIFSFVDLNYADKLPGLHNENVYYKNITEIFKKYEEKYYKLAKETINGKYGNGAERVARLKSLGYDYNFVQAIVNKLVK